MRHLILAALLVAPGAARAECPDGSEQVATPHRDRPWVCALTHPRARDGSDCPSGSQAITVFSSDHPSRCALIGADPPPAFGRCPPGTRSVPGAKGGMVCERDGAPPVASFGTRSRCPRGYAAVSAGKGRGTKCVPEGQVSIDEEDDAAAAAPPAPAAARPAKPAAPIDCPAGTKRLRTENPFEPFQCLPDDKSTLPALDPKNYKRYQIPGEMRFEYPAGWRVTDAWKDDVPSVFLQLEASRDGKPVVLTLSRYRRGSSSFQEMATLIRQEKEWRGAREGGKGAVAGLPARFLEVPRETKLAYLRTADGFLLLSYSAPEDLFAVYAPAFARLMKTLVVVHDEKDPLPEEVTE